MTPLPAQSLNTPPALQHRGCDGCVGRTHCPFSVLPANLLAASPVVERSFQKGDVLQVQGEVEPVFRVVKVGSFLLKRRGPDRCVRPVALLGSGYMLGLFALAGGSNNVTCVATSGGRWCELNVDTLTHAYLSHTEFRERVAAVYGRTFARVADWSHVTRIRGIVGQVAGALLLLMQTQRSEVVQLPGQADLAELLGTRRETVARVLGQLEAQGALVRRDRRHCEVREQTLLELVGSGQPALV
jgi:CRP/FNR family transcriptional regulator, cyclic AMP receptor protein